jgi:hypothetical protein
MDHQHQKWKQWRWVGHQKLSKIDKGKKKWEIKNQWRSKWKHEAQKNMQIQIRKMKTHKSQLNPNVKRTQLNSWNKRCKNEEHEKQPFQKKQ